MASTNRSLPLNPLVCPTCEQVVRHRCAGPPPAKPQLPGQMSIPSGLRHEAECYYTGERFSDVSSLDELCCCEGST